MMKQHEMLMKEFSLNTPADLSNPQNESIKISNSTYA